MNEISPTKSKKKGRKLFGLFRKLKKKQRGGDESVATPSASISEGVPNINPAMPATTTKALAKKRNEKIRRPWLCRTRFFKGMIENSFKLIDQDNSGSVDEKELYSGLLLIHLNLGLYAGPAACKPISREKCHDVFVKMDKDHSGTLDEGEFAEVMMVLFGNVLMRVLFQYACTLLLVPMVAQALLDGIEWGIYRLYELISTMDERSEVADLIEVSLEQVWEHAIRYWSSRVPEGINVFAQTAGRQIQEALQTIPDSIWETIPLTLLSAVLSLMLIPWSLLKIDDLFQKLADSNSKRKQE